MRELGMGAKAMKSAYPDKKWILLNQRVGNGRPRTVRTAANIEKVSELIASQEDQPGTGKSTRRVLKEINISRSLVRRIAKNDLNLSTFRQVPTQILSHATKQKRLDRSMKLLRRFKAKDMKRIFFTDKKNYYLHPPVNRQNDRVWAVGRK